MEQGPGPFPRTKDMCFVLHVYVLNLSDPALKHSNTKPFPFKAPTSISEPAVANSAELYGSLALLR